MARILISYFSLTGNTRKLAERLAEATGAELQPILDAQPRQGWRGYLRSALEAVRGKAALTLPPALRADDYDLVVIGSPVWVGHVSSPARSYLLNNAARFKSIALFCTMGGTDAARALQEMTQLAGREPLATLAVSARELERETASTRVHDFIGRLARVSSQGRAQATTAKPDSGGQHASM